MPNRTPYDLSQRLPYLINRVGVAIVERATDGGLRDFHLTIPMWRVMAVLAHRGEARQVDLAEATSLDAPTVSRLISTGARRGLVTRARSNTSNREVTVRLTKAGRDIVERLIPLMVRLETVLFKGVSVKELATFKKILRLMYANMADYHGNGAMPAKRGRAARKS